MKPYIQILDVKNSFSWVQESMKTRIPKLLSKYNFDPQNVHMYQAVALHPIQDVQQLVGIVDFPREIVLKSTYTSIEKGANINHKIRLNPNYRTIILDAEFESERQEYVIASDDPEIFRLVQEGYITAISIQGTPRFYLEDCGQCTTNCRCKLVPEGLILGETDGIAIALVMTRDGAYFGQAIRGEPPVDKKTSITIMMTEKDSGTKNEMTLTLTELSQTPRENLHTLFTSNKRLSSKTSMADNPPDNPPANPPVATPPANPPAGNDDLKATISALTQKMDTITNDMKSYQDQVTKLTDDLKKANDDNKTSFTNLTQIVKDAQTKMSEIEKTTSKVTLTQHDNDTPSLSSTEISVAKEELVRTTPFSEFVPAKAK